MKKLALFAAALFASVGVFLTPVAVFAQTTVNPDICKGINFADPSSTGSEDCTSTGEEGETALQNIITTIINIFSIIVGAVSVIMIILGGLRYVTSSGDSAAVTSAKNTILYAIVGLIIVIFAQTIVKFVVGRIFAGQGA